VNRFVADVSVSAKWILRGPEERLVAQARHFLLQLVNGDIEILVPDLFWVELGNVLWKAVLAGRCTKTLAESGLRDLKEEGLLTVPSHSFIEAALEIAIAFDRTVYDSVYIALARDRNAQLITADEKLANAVAAQFPVRWLGAL
jgi:predicted nucleic acid-binding protein